uniref:hypothetical protein n=1 Tax=Desertihabitans aurantiacus TaxID=2282477 RepID=UPI000DF80383
MDLLTACLRAGSVLLAAAGVVALPLVLLRLPEPAAPPGEDGPGYRALVRPGTVLIHGVVALVGAVVVLLAVPPTASPLWWALLSAGTACAVVDAATTWIPRQLCWAGWAVGGVGVAVALLARLPVGDILVALLATAVTTALFWAVWRWGGGRSIGFGDVRLVPLVGLAAGSMGWDGWWLGLLLGTAGGALQAVLGRLRGRGASMPYGPALVAG